MKIKERYQRFIDYFEENMPDPKTELNYENDYQLLVAVILSAQSTDKRINMVTPALFEAYPDITTLAKATQDEVFEYISSVTYPNNKSKSLVGMANKLTEDFDGKIPSTVEELITLPGVGRKTANVVTSVLFGAPNMPVDTHVFRVSKRIGLTTNAKTTLEAEKQLVRHIPKEIIPKAHHWLILHGRYVCKARNPNCVECGIKDICKDYSKKNPKP